MNLVIESEKAPIAVDADPASGIAGDQVAVGIRPAADAVARGRHEHAGSAVARGAKPAGQEPDPVPRHPAAASHVDQDSVLDEAVDQEAANDDAPGTDP